MRRNGGLIGKNNSSFVDAANGVWETKEQSQYERDGAWPSISLNITNTANLTNTSALSTYTYSSVALGNASADRHIIVAGAATDVGAQPTSVTIGGVTATLVINSNAGNGSVFIYYASVPSGTTGDIVLSFGVTQNRTTISVFSVTGSSSMSVVDTFDSADLNGSGAINTAVGGVMAGIRYTGGAGSNLSLTWSNSIVANSTLVSGMVWVSAYSKTFGTSETISWQTTGSPSNRRLAVASFQL